MKREPKNQILAPIRHSRRHGRGLWSPIRRLAGEKIKIGRDRQYGDPPGSSGLERVVN